MSKNKQNTFIPNKEVFGRMNFLYQASMLMAKQSNSTLSSYYGRQCQSIGKKAQLKISPNVKRNFCKRCALAQQPGLTADLEVVPQKHKKSKQLKNANGEHENIDIGVDVYMKCRKCENKRTFIVNPKYDFWLEKSEATEVVKIQQKNVNSKNGASNLQTKPSLVDNNINIKES